MNFMTTERYKHLRSRFGWGHSRSGWTDPRPWVWPADTEQAAEDPTKPEAADDIVRELLGELDDLNDENGELRAESHNLERERNELKGALERILEESRYPGIEHPDDASVYLSMAGIARDALERL